MNDVILLAKGETRALCPFDAEEVWGVNDVGSDPQFKDKKIHKIFRFDPTDSKLLAEMRKVAPIVSWHPYADIHYPIEEIQKEFDTSYLANSISYMIAYAIYIGVKQLRLFGVDAPYGGIYEIERSGIEYWVGRAAERGTKVIPSKGSHLLRTITGKLYGKPREGNIPLYFAERLILMNALPVKGYGAEMEKCSLARWLIVPKERECKEYGVEMIRNSNGSVGWKVKQEFASDIWMPQATWEYVADELKKLADKGELPVEAATVYKKLVLLPGGYETKWLEKDLPLLKEYADNAKNYKGCTR
jgi:hypothetical protein